MRNFIIFVQLTPCLLLAACFLASDLEIQERISQALPANTEFQIDGIEKSFACISASITALEASSTPDFDGPQSQSTSSGLGQTWTQAGSFFDYVEMQSQSTHKSTIEGTIVHARPCMDGTKFDRDLLYNRQVSVTASNSGKELLLVFDQAEPWFGIYLAQGR